MCRQALCARDAARLEREPTPHCIATRRALTPATCARALRRGRALGSSDRPHVVCLVCHVLLSGSAWQERCAPHQVPAPTRLRCSLLGFSRTSPATLAMPYAPAHVACAIGGVPSQRAVVDHAVDDAGVVEGRIESTDLSPSMMPMLELLMLAAPSPVILMMLPHPPSTSSMRPARSPLRAWPPAKNIHTIVFGCRTRHTHTHVCRSWLLFERAVIIIGRGRCRGRNRIRRGHQFRNIARTHP